jgi:hypothetical protein
MPPLPYKNKPLCLRLPDDLHLAVVQLARDANMNTSEWMRDVLFRVVYGEPPGVDEGYAQGRQIATAAALALIRDAVLQAVASLPATAEEAIPLTQGGSIGRRGGQ